MLRLFVLVGMMVLLQDTMMQLVVGTLLAAAFLLFQVQASPYVNLSDDLLAAALSFCVVAVFLCSYAFKDAALTGLEAIQDKMSIEQRSLYILNQATLSAIMVCGVIAALVISGIIFIFQLAEEAARVTQTRGAREQGTPPTLRPQRRGSRRARHRRRRVPPVFEPCAPFAIEPNTICSRSGAFCPLNLWLDPQWQVWGSGQVRWCPTDTRSRTCEQRCSRCLIC